MAAAAALAAAAPALAPPAAAGAAAGGWLAAWAALLAARGPVAYGQGFFALAAASAPVQVPLEVAAGALFGVRRGVAVVSVAKNADCLAAFIWSIVVISSS